MHISRIVIQNFRCIRSLDVQLNPTTVIIGENNAGKSTLLDAIKLALGRRWGRSGQTGFNEYDFPMTQGGQPKPDILIKLWFAEAAVGEWPQSLQDDLLPIIRLDPVTGLNSICLQVTCSFESVTKSVEPSWVFLNEDDAPYAGAGARNQNLSKFFDYAPCFSLAAMRDANVEFGGRSRFWGGLLKTIEVSPEKTAELEASFAALNGELLQADPKLEAIKATLKTIGNVIANGAAADVDVRAIPVNLWEIINKAEVVIQGQGGDPWLPIGRHGHGVQSLAIIFLFRAFVENALAASSHENAQPILALEEPEAHLHPQACRALWDAVSALPGQKIITTHSPFFVQNVPFRDIVILRRHADGPQASFIAHSYEAEVPDNAELQRVVARYPDVISWTSDRLACSRHIEQNAYRELLMCYQADRAPHANLAALRDQSRKLMVADDIQRLETWAKRIRGEIFFSNKWILCEGQSDYAVLQSVSRLLGCPLDAHGISVIDYQNNGSAGAFSSLARALDFPWAMVCDGDQGGDDHIQQLLNHAFNQDEINTRVRQLPREIDLEGLLITSNLRELFRDAVHELNDNIADADIDLLAFARDHKEETALRFAARLDRHQNPADVPAVLRELFVIIGACQ
ncbi:MAG: DUF2813 domain-containing protein [Alphaproteobacteria bacterium]|nr:MAG: DUF2813 domain-containing protein [Alphaproteobacteria bacterium]